MANMGKQYISSRPVSNLGQRKSIFEQSKFPQPSPNMTPSLETTDFSGYRQPQSGEMMVNVMDSLSTSKSASPPNYITGKQLTAPKRQGREVNMASVNQLKASPRQSNLSEKPIQKQEETIPNQTGLPDNLKAGIENLSGYSLDNVRVHYNSPKPTQLQALAYTQGTEIHVAPGQEKHLPHEAWHVVQQMQGRVKPTMQMKGVQINDDEGLENEAEVMGDKAYQLIDNRGETVAHRQVKEYENNSKQTAPSTYLISISTNSTPSKTIIQRKLNGQDAFELYLFYLENYGEIIPFTIWQPYHKNIVLANDELQEAKEDVVRQMAELENVLDAEQLANSVLKQFGEWDKKNFYPTGVTGVTVNGKTDRTITTTKEDFDRARTIYEPVVKSAGYHVFNISRSKGENYKATDIIICENINGQGSKMVFHIWGVFI